MLLAAQLVMVSGLGYIDSSRTWTLESTHAIVIPLVWNSILIYWILTIAANILTLTVSHFCFQMLLESIVLQHPLLVFEGPENNYRFIYFN